MGITRQGAYKFNIDGAVTRKMGPGGIGDIFRDHEGRWKLGYTQPIPHVTPIVDLQIATSHNLFSLEIDTDAKGVI